jgi:hypothetical protein
MNYMYRYPTVESPLADISIRSTPISINRLMTEVFFCHQNQNAINIGYFTTPLKPHSIGTHMKGIETRFQVVPLFFEILPLLGEWYITF